MRAVVAMVVVACVGCIDAKFTPCGSLSCPSGEVCTPDQTCVTGDQIAACSNIAEGARCTYGESIGFCHHGACVVSLGLCGDGVSQLSHDELCDCGTPDLLSSPPTGCAGFNSSEPGATCRSDCRPARCGDSIVDTNELCDDGNLVSGDGCRGDCQGRFAKLQTPTARSLSNVLAVDATDAYAVGVQGTSIHFDGAAWLDLGLPSSDFTGGGWASSSNDVYLSGQSSLFHFDGSAWVTVDLGAFYPGFVWGLSPSDVYVTATDASVTHVVFHFDGLTWTQMTARPSACGIDSVTAILGTNPTDIYIASWGGGLCHFNGVAWTKVDAVGASGLAHTTSSEIVELTNSYFPPQNLRRWVAGVETGPAVLVPGQTDAITATSPTEIIVVGAQGTVLQFDGTSWTHLSVPTELQLMGISATSPSNVFIVGEAGVVLH